MSQISVTKTPAERLFTILLSNENVRNTYTIKKILEAETTIIRIIHRAEDHRSEQFLPNHIIQQ